jgi:hypothetical protein
VPRGQMPPHPPLQATPRESHKDAFACADPTEHQYPALHGPLGAVSPGSPQNCPPGHARHCVTFSACIYASQTDPIALLSQHCISADEVVCFACTEFVSG